VEDCKALLARYGFVGGDEDPYEQFNVWGGEQMDPPMYGRVFVTLSDTAEVDPVAATTAIDILEQKTCVTIHPEFVNPIPATAGFRGTIRWDPLQTNLNRSSLQSLIVDKIFRAYPSRFEHVISAVDISRLINDIDPAFRVTPSDISISLTMDASVGADGWTQPLSFNNPCQRGSLVSGYFVAGSSIDIDLEFNPDRLIRVTTDPSSTLNNKGVEPIYAVYNAGGLEVNLGVWGGFNASKGTVTFKRGVSSDDNISITVLPTEMGEDRWYIKHNMKSQIVQEWNMEII